LDDNAEHVPFELVTGLQYCAGVMSVLSTGYLKSEIAF